MCVFCLLIIIYRGLGVMLVFLLRKLTFAKKNGIIYICVTRQRRSTRSLTARQQCRAAYSLG
jgi:hypothetical protein